MRVDRAKARAALERDLGRHRASPTVAPRSGWIRAVRDALGMSARDLATRVGRSPQRISQIEQAERDRSLTLASLERVAAGLGCRVEFVLVPDQSLDEMVWEQARRKAAAEVAAADHTMALEGQQPSAESSAPLVERVARTYVDKRGLWS